MKKKKTKQRKKEKKQQKIDVSGVWPGYNIHCFDVMLMFPN